MAERLKVLGPPGTGKTRFLMDICADELSNGRRPDEIIFCSFTRAAVNEARDRAITQFGYVEDEFPWFATEHSICYRLLGLTPGNVFNDKELKNFSRQYHYDISLFNGSHLESMETRLYEGMLNTIADHYEFFVNFMENTMLPFNTAYNQFKRSIGELPDGFTLSGVKDYIDRRNNYKKEHNLWSFPDMIKGVIDRKLRPIGTKVLIFDESQDSSPLLYELIKMWSESMESYYIAGDPLQALFTFAGASPRLFYEFPGEEHILRHSYRLTEEVKQFSQRIIERTSLPFPEFQSSGRHHPIGLALLESVPWEEVGPCFVLARTHYLIKTITEYFMSMGIPFRAERGKHNIIGTTKGRAFCTLAMIAEGEKVSNEDIAFLCKHTGKPFLKYGAKAKAYRLVDGMYTIDDLAKIGFTDVFMKTVGSSYFEEALLNIEPEEQTYLKTVYEKGGMRAFLGESNIIVTTIHGSKGREKPMVFLTPDLTKRVWEGYIRDREPESMVFYVGATRAIDELVILRPTQNYTFPLPSR